MSNKYEYKIKLNHVGNNGLHLISAKYDLSFNQVISLALDEYLRKKLKTGEYNALDESDHINHLIGETINANRGVWGYDPEVNDIPNDKKHLLIKC